MRAACSRRRTRKITMLAPTETASAADSASGAPSGTTATCSVRTAAAKPTRPHMVLAMMAAVAGPPIRGCRISNQAGAQRNVEPAPHDGRYPRMEEALRQGHAGRIGRATKDDSAGERPRHRADQEGADEPCAHRSRDRDRKTGALRRQYISHAENSACGVDRKACHRAVGDELAVVIEGKQDIGGTRGDRQRRHHGADQCAGALGNHRSGDNDRGRCRHLERDDEKEGGVGRHGEAGGRTGSRAGGLVPTRMSGMRWRFASIITAEVACGGKRSWRSP